MTLLILIGAWFAYKRLVQDHIDGMPRMKNPPEPPQKNTIPDFEYYSDPPSKKTIK